MMLMVMKLFLVVVFLLILVLVLYDHRIVSLLMLMNRNFLNVVVEIILLIPIGIDHFLSELTKLFQQQRVKNSGSLSLTMKRYDGRTKPKAKLTKKQRLEQKNHHQIYHLHQQQPMNLLNINVLYVLYMVQKNYQPLFQRKILIVFNWPIQIC